MKVWYSIGKDVMRDGGRQTGELTQEAGRGCGLIALHSRGLAHVSALQKRSKPVDENECAAWVGVPSCFGWVDEVEVRLRLRLRLRSKVDSVGGVEVEVATEVPR